MNDTAILLPPSSQTTGQNLVLFRIYLIYRTILSAVFLLLLILPATRQLVGSENPSLYAGVSVVLLLSNITFLGGLTARWHQSDTGLGVLFCVDILCITLLSDASGGMGSGIPLLLTITVASSAVLISNRTIATLIAAVAVLAILLDTLRLMSITGQGIKTLFPAGLLGILFFVVSGLVQLITLRLGRAEAIASARASDLYRLQRLNEQIVQHMQTGILLVDLDASARVMNAAAGRMLDPSRPVTLEQGRQLNEYSEELAERLDSYRRQGEQDTSPFNAGTVDAEVVARFHALGADASSQVLVFLEDYRPVAAFAQSLKLSSLGRLAASIAHEIRNPLGAISHAAQLLEESESITDDDRRMLQLLLTNSQRVNDIVESVLQISRREPPRPEEILLAEWLPEYIERYGQARENPGQLHLEFAHPEARILFDPEHLQRIIDNLVDNAMRHSSEETGIARAELRARIDAGHRECIIDIIDDGAGVEKTDIPRLFEPFFTRSHGGSGLGLYLCRELCELNQARISYVPTSDLQSRFQITVLQQE